MTQPRNMNEVIETIETAESTKKYIHALVDPEVKTYKDIAKKCHCSISAISNAFLRFRNKYEKQARFVKDADFIAVRIGKKGRRLIG